MTVATKNTLMAQARWKFISLLKKVQEEYFLLSGDSVSRKDSEIQYFYTFMCDSAMFCMWHPMQMGSLAPSDEMRKDMEVCVEGFMGEPGSGTYNVPSHFIGKKSVTGHIYRQKKLGIVF